MNTEKLFSIMNDINFINSFYKIYNAKKIIKILHIYSSLQKIATKLSELNKFEDSLRKNNILPDEEKKLYDNY